MRTRTQDNTLWCITKNACMSDNCIKHIQIVKQLWNTYGKIRNKLTAISFLTHYSNNPTYNLACATHYNKLAILSNYYYEIGLAIRKLPNDNGPQIHLSSKKIFEHICSIPISGIRPCTELSSNIMEIHVNWDEPFSANELKSHRCHCCRTVNVWFNGHKCANNGQLCFHIFNLRDEWGNHETELIKFCLNSLTGIVHLPHIFPHPHRMWRCTGCPKWL